MAGGQERALRRRIKSVQNTKKITRAMEMIAASRIVKAQQRVSAARPYAEQITEVIRNLSAAGAGEGHPLLTERETVSNLGLVVVTADRGLCGGYNANVQRLADSALREIQDEGKGYRLFVCGKKGVSFFRFRHYDITEDFTGFSDNPGYEDARAVAGAAVKAFEDGDVDQVDLIYTQFLSLGTQRPTRRRFLPVQTPDVDSDKDESSASDYEFEPGPEEILDRLLPRYVESRMFSALLEAAASEHAARQRAMKSATDNAGDLIKRLERQMNRARQDSITTEIIEIASGAEALSEQGEPDDSPDYFRPHEVDTAR